MQNLQNYTNLSVREFKDTCDSLSPSRFIFSSENQSWSKTDHMVNFSITFPIMLIAFNPNTICFKNSTDYLCLERVKYIQREKEKSALGTVFTVVCGNFNNSLNDMSYTIIAR